MQNKISLLYTDTAQRKLSEVARRAVYNLNIDRMIAFACDNKRQSDYFLDVLCRAATKNDADYRAEILRDFINYPDLLDALIQIFRGYEGLPEETEELINEIFRYGVPASSAGMLDCAYEELYVNAHYARNVIAYFSEISELLDGYDVKSKGLSLVKGFCAKMNESKCITETEKAAAMFKSEHLDAYKFVLDAKLNEAMQICSCSLSGVLDKGAKEKVKLIDRIKNKAPITVNLGSSCTDNAQKAVSAAISELSGIFADIAAAVYDVFKGIGEELAFYKVALLVEKRLRENGMHYCFPTVLDATEDTLQATEIYDMLLLSEGKNVKNIVTNDVSLHKSILARGDNNCGKTSFLRALGTAVIFAQNGLFVCARNAKSSIRTAIFTHFSSAENDFSENDAAGRFEGEVKEIAAIMDEIEPHSLVLLNETFQTTAYREGAQGMKEILQIFPKINCKYVFVTHMTAIFEIFPKDEAAVLTAKGFKLTTD